MISECVAEHDVINILGSEAIWDLILVTELSKPVVELLAFLFGLTHPNILLIIISSHPIIKHIMYVLFKLCTIPLLVSAIESMMTSRSLRSLVTVPTRIVRLSWCVTYVWVITMLNTIM